MKKVALSLAGVLAAATFAPEASAVPAFARQTGMACSACHAQHFPVLNGFGRAFKAAGFTMMGSQEKVEGENMSIPATLNFGVLVKARYQKSNGATAAGELSGETTNSGQWQIPDEYSLFWGGRVADTGTIKIGTMTEFDVGGGSGTLGLRIPVVVDMDSVKLSVIPFATDALGPFYGYSESSTGVTRGIRWAEHRKEISAHQYTGIGAGPASGIAFVAHTDMGYLNISRWSPNLFYAAGDAGTNMGSTAVTIAATPTIADFAVVAGLQFLTGNSVVQDPLGAYFDADTKGVGIDAQAHGEVAGMEAGFYASYAKATKTDAGKLSGLAISGVSGKPTAVANDIKAIALGADFTVIPHTLSLGAAYRKGTNKANQSDNAITLTAVYDLVQNVALHANFSKYSGDAYNGTPADGTQMFTGMLEAAW